MHLSCDSFQASVLSQNLLTTPFCLCIFMTQVPVSVFPIHLWFSSPRMFPLNSLVLFLLSFHHLWLLHINSFSIYALSGPSLVSLPSSGTCQHFLAYGFVASILCLHLHIIFSCMCVCVCVCVKHPSVSLTWPYVLPRWLNSKESACNAGDVGSIPGSWRSLGEGNVNALQFSCLRNPMDRGASWATVHRVTKEWDMF